MRTATIVLKCMGVAAYLLCFAAIACSEPGSGLDMHQRLEQLEARMAVVEYHANQHGYTEPPEVPVWPGIPQEDMPGDLD